MSVSYGGDSITFADNSTISSGWTGFKNRIINGAMTVDQRGNGTVYPILGGNQQWATDRWKSWCNNGSTANVSIQTTTTAPEGFTSSIKATVTAAQASNPSNFYSMIWQGIEGYNIADLGWGTAAAKTATLSFWVRASVAGPYGGHVVNNTGSSYPFLYTINSVDTWEYKTVVISGPTSGTWYTDYGAGAYVGFSLGAGSTQSGTAATWNHSSSYFYGTTGQTNMFATNGSNLYITGVQFERGSTASSFEWRPYQVENLLTKRYFECKLNSRGQGYGQCSNWCSNGDNSRMFIFSGGWEVTKRTTPAISIWSAQTNTANKISGYSSGTEYTLSSINGRNTTNFATYMQLTSGPAGSEQQIFYFSADAEL